MSCTVPFHQPHRLLPVNARGAPRAASPCAPGGLRVCLCLPVLWTVRAQAGLGGDELSVRADQAELQGMSTTTVRAGYDMVEIKTGSGMVVREFANPAGTIFALAWSGPASPDLRQLLGVHFDTYARALAQLERPGLHRSLRVESADLVVECGGHLRAYSGRAYLPHAVPVGFSMTDLR